MTPRGTGFSKEEGKILNEFIEALQKEGILMDPNQRKEMIRKRDTLLMENDLKKDSNY